MIKKIKIILKFIKEYIYLYFFKKLKKKNDDYILHNARIFIHALEKYRIEEKIIMIFLQFFIAFPFFKESIKRNLFSEKELLWAKRIMYGYDYSNNINGIKENKNLSIIDKIILNRRSIRTYIQEEIPDKDIEKIIEIALWSPSACNRQPWKFIIVRDKNIINFISKMKEKWISNAPLILVLLINKHAYNEIDINYTPYIDAGIIAQTLMLKAYSMGYGTCFINMGEKEIDREKRAKIKNILGISDDWVFVGIITLGRPKKIPKAPGRKELKEILEYK